jgi:hypothetical protein
MPTVRTSTIFYRRGVPDSFKSFGAIASGNYSVVQPTTPFINAFFFSQRMGQLINVSR